ncbi:MAG: FAD-binding oxidoreductase [Myxococcales bacterium]|nr:FAD-binding oxidoreductase [Myxococcales bacterium]
MSASWWMRAVQPVCEAEVVVVGAGICGVSAALALEAAGHAVVLLDRAGLGGGASVRNAGFLMRGAAECYAEACRLYGRDTARALWRLTEENLAALDAHGIGALASVQRVPSALLALDADELEDLERSRAWLEEDGFAVGWERGGRDPVWRSGRALGALINPGDAACNPVEVLAFLASKLRARVEADAEVLALEVAGPKVELVTRRVRYRAERVLVATNAYLAQLVPSAAAWVSPRRGQMLALEAPSVTLTRSYYVNRGSEYFRQAADGAVVVGGFRTPEAATEVGYDDRVTASVQSSLEGFAREMLGVDGRVLTRWSGVMGFSPDGLPIVGAVPGFAGVYFAGGFTGHGMSMGYKVAELAAEVMFSPRETLFSPGRFAQ